MTGSSRKLTVSPTLLEWRIAAPVCSFFVGTLTSIFRLLANAFWPQSPYVTRPQLIGLESSLGRNLAVISGTTSVYVITSDFFQLGRHSIDD